MAVSKRIQVLLKPHLTAAVEKLAEQEGETLSRMTALLVQEALTARGLNTPLTNHLPPEIEDSIRREVTASERGWKPNDGKEVLEEMTPEWNTSPNVEVQQVSRRTVQSDEAQMMKLKLMQELMEQLKSM